MDDALASTCACSPANSCAFVQATLKTIQFSVKEAELNQIQLARQNKNVSDLETSAIDSVRSRKSIAKTLDFCLLPQVQKLHQ